MRLLTSVLAIVVLLVVADTVSAQRCNVGPQRIIVQQVVQPSPLVFQQVQGVQFVPLVQQVRFVPLVQQVRGVGPLQRIGGNFIDNRQLIRQQRALRTLFGNQSRFSQPIIVF